MPKSRKTVLPNGTVEWRNEAGELHREDGPAIEHVSGYRAWHIYGTFIRCEMGVPTC